MMKKALGIVSGLLAAVAGIATVASAPVAAQHPAVVDDAQIELAKFGVTMFSLDHLTEPASECPAVRQDEMGFWMGQLGMAGTTQGYAVEAFSPDDVEALAIFCGVNPVDFVATPDPAAPYAIALEVYELLEGATFAQVIERSSVPATIAPTPDPALGGEVASYCSESTTAGREICFAFWHRTGLVLNIYMVGPSAELDTAKAQQLMLSMVDNAVTNLAAYESTFSDSPTTVAAPATTTPVSTTFPVPASTLPASTVAIPTVPVVATTVPAPLPTAAPPTIAPVPTAAPLPTTPVSTGPVLPTVPGVTTPTVPGAPTTLPAGFVRVTDDSGLISVAIPSTWTDVQTAGLVLDDGTTTPQLIASTNVASYEATFDVPGISIVTAAPIADPQSIVTSNGLTGGCATFTTEPYSDGVFTGFAQIGTSCGSAGGSWKMIVGNTIDGTTGVIISLQTASPADQLAIDTALQTLVVT
jgi:hypothetical protein